MRKLFQRDLIRCDANLHVRASGGILSISLANKGKRTRYTQIKIAPNSPDIFVATCIKRAPGRRTENRSEVEIKK